MGGKKKAAANNGVIEEDYMAQVSPFGVANMAIFAARKSSSSLSTILEPGGPPGPGDDDALEEKFRIDATSENLGTEKTDERFPCKFCTKTFLLKVGLRKHKLKAHTGQASDGDIACKFCPSLFNKAHMFKHMIAKHPLEVASAPEEKVSFEEKISLPTPKTTFQENINLPTPKTAFQEKINLPTPTFQDIRARCQFCPKAFAGQEFLEKHIGLKHPEKVVVEKEKELVTEFQCDQCQKYLGSKSALKNHMPLHLEEKPFKCESCGKEFSQSGNLRVHMKRHHTNQENEGIDIWPNVTQTDIVGNIIT